MAIRVWSLGFRVWGLGFRVFRETEREEARERGREREEERKRGRERERKRGREEERKRKRGREREEERKRERGGEREGEKERGREEEQAKEGERAWVRQRQADDRAMPPARAFRVSGFEFAVWGSGLGFGVWGLGRWQMVETDDRPMPPTRGSHWRRVLITSIGFETAAAISPAVMPDGCTRHTHKPYISAIHIRMHGETCLGPPSPTLSPTDPVPRVY